LSCVDWLASTSRTLYISKKKKKKKPTAREKNTPREIKNDFLCFALLLCQKNIVFYTIKANQGFIAKLQPCLSGMMVRKFNIFLHGLVNNVCARQ
jgi:hypothetical protein